MLLGHNFINGKRSAAGSVSLHSLDATTDEALLLSFMEATRDEVDAAALAADGAYHAYRTTTAEQRATFLDAVADELDALDDEFIAMVCRETALPAGRIQGERARTSGQMRLFAKLLRRGDFYGARIDRALPERQPLPRPDLRQYHIGLGPVAVFGASNFPLAFSGLAPQQDSTATAAPLSRASRAPTMDWILLLEPGLPANQTTILVRHSALSFFAGKPRSNLKQPPYNSTPPSIRVTASPPIQMSSPCRCT